MAVKKATVKIHADGLIDGIAYRRCPKCKELKALDEFGLRTMVGQGENGLDLLTNQSWCQECR